MLLIANNPVDIFTQAIQELSKRLRNLVIGTGTLLDTSCFITLLAQFYDVSPRSVHAYILGEHGDSEIPIWSTATVDGLTINNHTINGRSFDQATMNDIFSQVKNAAYEIISNKGHTNWAIGLVIASIVSDIKDNQRRVLPVTTRLEGEYGINNVCLSIPAVIGHQGVESHIVPDLSEQKLAGIRLSAGTLQQYIYDLELH